MKIGIGLLSLSLGLVLAGCSQPQLPTGTRLFVTDYASGSTRQISATREKPTNPALGWTIDARGAVPHTDYVQIFAVSSGPLKGMIGTDPTFAGAPSHPIGYVSLRPFKHSVKLVISNAQRPGQLADGSQMPKAEAFGYAIANPTAS